ncbi:MAG TPA: trigger factor [Actinomycetota bacterium]
METTLEETDRHTVKLSVEVPPDEFKKDLDRAYRHVAGEVKIPGFRKGKAPRQVIDTMVGRDHVVEHFLRESVPAYYAKAVREHDLAPIAEPEIDLDPAELTDGRPLRFTAVVEVRPRLVLEPQQYKGVTVDAPSSEPTEVEIDDYIGHLRERFAELEIVSRPAHTGDFVLADVRAHVHDREVTEATRVGFLTEVGAKDLVPELDTELEGKRKGDILKFNATLGGAFGDASGQEVAFQVLVKEVKAKTLPAADDEFAKTASEFDTMQELRDDVRTKLRALKQSEVGAVVRDLALRKVVDSVDVDLPERLVDEETNSRLESSVARLERAGVTLQQALDAEGFDELQFRADTRSHAVQALKADLVLEAVARQEELSVTAEDLDAEIAAVAERTGREPKQIRRLLERSGQIATLAGDIIRSKALDLIVESADVTSKDTPTEPEPPEPNANDLNDLAETDRSQSQGDQEDE